MLSVWETDIKDDETEYYKVTTHLLCCRKSSVVVGETLLLPAETSDLSLEDVRLDVAEMTGGRAQLAWGQR